MEIHEKFTEWAIEKGVKINGIRPHRFEGRGLGIIAERDFKVRRTSSRCFCMSQLVIFRSCSRLAIRVLHYEFPVSSILLRLHVLLSLEAISHKKVTYS